jgi:predicted MFS family arabinose efflux permease
MVAGAAVPLLGLTVGWRATFALGLLLAPVVWLVLPPQVGAGRPPGAVPVGHRRPSRRVLLLIALGSAAGTGAATATASFLVPAATVAGLAAGTAGTLLAVGSLLSITARIVAGHLADGARRRELTVTAGMLAVGTAGPLLLASDLRTAAVVGGLVALGAGWGWTGLVFLSAVRADPAAPAAAAGIVLAGLSTGGALGPIAFGVVVSQVGYQVAWLLAALAMAIGAVAIYAANRSSHPSPENTTA